MPAGLTLSSAGVISSTPTAATTGVNGTSLTIQATDSTGCVGTIITNLKVCPVITITPSTLPNGTVGISYAQSLAAAGGAAPYTWALASGSLPAGVTLSSGGLLSGSPTTAATSSFTVRATDAFACTGQLALTLKICPIDHARTRRAAGRHRRQRLQPDDHGQRRHRRRTDSPSSPAPCPAGLTSATGGGLTGTPTTANGPGVNITIQAQDATGCPGTRNYALQICPVIALSPTSLPVPSVGTAYSQTISASGGVAPYTYAVTSGALPAWASLNASTGVVSGTPNNTTSVTFTVSPPMPTAAPAAAVQHGRPGLPRHRHHTRRAGLRHRGLTLQR